MAKVSVIYRAPKGDSKVAEWGPHTFFDGVPVEIEDNEDNAHMLKKMKINQYFELSEMGVKGKSGPQPGPRPAPPNPAPTPPEPEPDEEDDTEAAEDEEPPFEDYKPAKNMPARKKGSRTRKTSKTSRARA